MEPTKDERIRAYHKAREASNLMDDAAAILLGHDPENSTAGVHDLPHRDDPDRPRHLQRGARALTNAYSYLNNGELEGLVDEDELGIDA